MRRCATGFFFGLFVWILTGPANAAVHVCVEIDADEKESEGLRKLVNSEIERYPSHQASEDVCETVLVVRLFSVDGRRYLTVRIGDEVPVRYRLDKGEALDKLLREGIHQVFQSDPAHLTQDIESYTRMQRASHSVLKKGHNIWRAELFEYMVRGQESLSFASGIAFGATRGADHVRVFARLHFAGRPGSLAPGEDTLRVSSGIDLGAVYELSALASATFYLGGGFGVYYQRYEGRVSLDGTLSTEAVNEVMPAPFVRLGGRWLRYCDFDLDVFAAFHLPLKKVRNADELLYGDKGLYAPFGSAGLGVGF